MNNCNNQGTCDQTTGQCVCNDGYKFADCSKQVISLEDKKWEEVEMTGPGWFTMEYTGKKSSSLSINPNITSDVYIKKSKSSDPNNFVYDMSFLGVSGNTTFNADNLGLTNDDGYSVAIYVPAVNETANQLLGGSLKLWFTEGASSLITASTVVLTAALSILS